MMMNKLKELTATVLTLVACWVYEPDSREMGARRRNLRGTEQWTRAHARRYRRPFDGGNDREIKVCREPRLWRVPHHLSLVSGPHYEGGGGIFSGGAGRNLEVDDVVIWTRFETDKQAYFKITEKEQYPQKDY